MDNTPTREELKAILDEWIPKYIRQVVELRSGSRLSAERYNELMNLLITQGDDTIELAETVKQYVEILVEETETEFELTTETVTNLANNAVSTANNAVNTVEEFKTVINRDITAFKEAVNQIANTANSNASLALQTADQLVLGMENYRVNLNTQIDETFINMRNALGVQVTNEVEVQMQGIQEALTADINKTISALSNEVRTIVNTAEQSVNSAVQDIEAYKTDMDVRLDEALREVEESLSAAGEVIKDASAIYAAINNKADIGELEAHTEDNAVHITEDERTAWNQSATDVSNIVNGTTPVGDALKLGGKGASEYALASQLNVKKIETGTDLNTCTEQGYYYIEGYAYNYVNTPNRDAHNGLMSVTKYSADRIEQLYYSINDGRLYVRAVTSTTTTEWQTLATTADLANYLPLTGGKIASSSTTTPLEIKCNDSTGGAYIKYSNSLGERGTIGFSATGKPIIKDVNGTTNDLLHSGNVGSYALPKTGGYYGGCVVSHSDYNVLGIENTGTGDPFIMYRNSTGTLGFIGVGANGKPTFKNGAQTANYDILHSGNIGSYKAGSAGSADAVAWANVTSKPTSFTPASHTQAASTITAGTLAGKVVANATAQEALTSSQVRDIQASTKDLTAGSSSLNTGTIYIFYE